MKKGVIEFTFTALIVLMSAATVIAAQLSLESYKNIFSEKAKLMLDYSKGFQSIAIGEDPLECQIAMHLNNIALMNQERLVTLCDFISICEGIADKEVELIIKPIIKEKINLYIKHMQSEIEQVGTALRCAKRPGVPESARKLREELRSIEKLFKSIDCGT